MRRAAAAVAVGLLAVLASAPAVAETPTPAPTKQEPEAPLSITVQDLLPRAPRAGSAVEITGTVANTSTTETIKNIKIKLSRGSVITLRGALHEAEQDGAEMTHSIKNRSLARGTQHVTDLKPGEKATFDIRTDVGDLSLRNSGVYPLEVDAIGDLKGETDTLGSASTWLPFFVDLPKQQKVAVVWPLTEKPHQAPDGSFVDDALASELGESGRLYRLANAVYNSTRHGCADAVAHDNNGHADPATTRCFDVPVTFAVDPDLISAADTMASADHYVFGPSRKRGAGKDVAKTWLDGSTDPTHPFPGIKALVARSTGSYLGLPYGDPDVDALATSLAGKDDVLQASKLGTSVLAQAFGSASVDAVYPPTQGSGTTSYAALDALTPTSAHRIAAILDPSAFADLEDLGYTPDAPVTVGSSGTHGLVSDDQLSTLVLGPTSGQEGPRLAEQRFIAETALLALERPSQSRTFLIAPDRYSDVATASAGLALRDIGVLPWLCPVSVESATQGSESCPVRTSSGEDSQHDDSETDPRKDLRPGGESQLPSSYLGSVAGDREEATQLTSEVLDGASTQSEDVLQQINDLRLRYRKAVARAESAAWRQDPSGQDDVLRRLGQSVSAERSGVAVLGGRLLLTSSKGTIQVSVQNSLDLPVKVRLRFTFPGRPPMETADISVAPKRSVPAGVKAEGLRSGKFPVDVQMLDQSGKAFQRPAQVVVRSTRYGRLALGVTFAAAAVLFIAAGFRIVRRAIRKPEAAE